MPCRPGSVPRRGAETGAEPAGVVREDQPTALADVRRIVGQRPTVVAGMGARRRGRQRRADPFENDWTAWPMPSCSRYALPWRERDGARLDPVSPLAGVAIAVP